MAVQGRDVACYISTAAEAARDLLERSVAWMDRYWDAEAGLLWDMGEIAGWDGSTHGSYHIVRESAWYALGLLMRGRTGDIERAVRALEAILLHQFDEPGKVYHGTFRRAPEEPHPPELAIEWKHYDPNWREFIITAIAVILSEYEEMLPRSLVDKIDVAIRKAVEGALDRRLTARYTNIALMDAQMLVYAGARLGECAWIKAGEAMGREVHRLFKQHDAFPEYNSPTYYGVDIYALGLWQAYCASPLLRQLGAEMEEVLWRDIAQFYHAGLKNVAGPYDRSYGMDMRRYVALLGEWIWLVTGREDAPFPDMAGPLAHAGDFCFGPLVALRAPRVPADVIPDFLAFRGERCVEHILSDAPLRKATAWLGERVMAGGEFTSLHDIGQGQFHPATIHWCAPLIADCRLQIEDLQSCQPKVGRNLQSSSFNLQSHIRRRGIGWVRLMAVQPVDAVAGPHRLEITSRGPVSFLIACPAMDDGGGTPSETWAADIKHDCWRLPGLEVRVQSSMPGFAKAVEGDKILVRYAPNGEQDDREAGQAFQILLDVFIED